MKQLNFSLTTMYTNEENSKYEHIWQIEDLYVGSPLENNSQYTVLQIRFKRQIRNYLYTIPSYIIYIMTLLMFMLPQTSNQRIIIGFN